MGPAGEITFHALGLVLDGGRLRVRYGEIERIERLATAENERPIAVILRSGQVLRLHCSEAGGEVVYATLRWIGNALLHRSLAD